MRKLLLRLIGPLGWLLSYAWFVIVGKTMWWLDFEFLKYDGPSTYLYLCSTVGCIAVLSLGMFPVAAYLHSCPTPWWRRTEAFERLPGAGRLPIQRWRLKDYLVVLGSSALLVVIYMMVSAFVFGFLGLAISRISEDAANTFLRFTTIMRE